MLCLLDDDDHRTADYVLEMIFARRRPELYEILPTTNEITRKYRPPAEPVP